MNPNLTLAVIAEHESELERQVGCCTPAAEHRRAIQGFVFPVLLSDLQVLAAMFTYACRADTYALAGNPVAGADKRREDPPAALDYYEVEDAEALARCCERGEHRGNRPTSDPAETAARQAEDRPDAEAFRLLFYTGLRLGEVLTLRWEDVDLTDRLLLVRRGLSAGQERSPRAAGTDSSPSPPPQPGHSPGSRTATSSPAPTTTCSRTASAVGSILPRCAAATPAAAKPPA
jgi:hypothetical protein